MKRKDYKYIGQC